MITFNNQAEYDALLQHLTNNTKMQSKLKLELAKHVKIVEDTEFEKKLDDLQNELAELEEIKDDMTVKLCYTRKDLGVELQNRYKREMQALEIEDVQEQEWDANKYTTQNDDYVVCDATNNACNTDFCATLQELDKTKKLLEEETSKKTIASFDVYKTAELYFDSI